MTTKTDNYRELVKKFRKFSNYARADTNHLDPTERDCIEAAGAIEFLARENERLLECVKEYARRETEAGESGDGLAQDCLAALPNAPTPNDKGKWNMEISQEDLRRLISGAYKAGVIGVVGLMGYSQYDYNRIGQDFAREQVARWIAEGGK